MKPSKLTFRMNESQYREAIKEYITAHPGIHSPALMSTLPLPRVKPLCHTSMSHILNDMADKKEIIQVIDCYPNSYAVRRRYYPIEVSDNEKK